LHTADADLNAGKRLRVRENALHLVFNLILRLSTSWRSSNAPNQLRLLLAGHRFAGGSRCWTTG
jgi:hypothetical protein